MRYKLHWASGIAALLVTFAPGVTAAEAKKPPARPAMYPRVILHNGSEPRYVAIELDSRDPSRVAYLLFDGSVERGGYDRMYVWSPGHEDFDKPVRLKKRDEDNSFREIKTESTHEGELSRTVWNIRAVVEMHGNSHTDYRTGAVTKTDARPVPRFYFVADIRRGPARRKDRVAGKWPLDLGMPGWLSVSDSWETCPAPYGPWKQTYCTLSRSPTYERGTGFIKCKAGLRFYASRWNNGNCIVRAMPEDTRLTVKAGRYLEKDVFTETYTMKESFFDGFEIGVPYGWYRINWTLKNRYFEAPPLHPNSDAWPMAFPRPVR
jgi:hypothetical protein